LDLGETDGENPRSDSSQILPLLKQLQQMSFQDHIRLLRIYFVISVLSGSENTPLNSIMAVNNEFEKIKK
jgi:hypothetical protein